MKTLPLVLCLLAPIAGAPVTSAAEPLSRSPVNPNATKEARQLLDFLYEIQGKRTVSGQHNFIVSGSRFSDRVHELTGKTPLLWGSDFSFAYKGEAPKNFQHCGPLNLTEPGTPVALTHLTPELARERLVRNAIQAHREGHIVTLMWHACPPGMGDACDGNAIWTLEKRPSQEWWDELTTDGTKLNTEWKAQVDVIAGYLKQLRDAHVPVLWRPYHEMNGVWFWWCNKKGPNGFRKLWLMMYQRYVNVHHLDNLVWVWNTNAPRDRPNDEAFAYRDFWPGGDSVDVLAADVYRDDWKQSHHDDLAKLGQGRPIAIGEMAPPPTLETLAAQPDWTWFMPWGNLAFWGDGPERLKALFASDRVLSREQVRRGEDGTYRIVSAQAAAAAPLPPPGPPPADAEPVPYGCEPVNPAATPEARDLLKLLCALPGKGILTGQHNFPNHLSQHSDKVFEITGKHPAVWGSDFGFLDGEDKDSIVHRDRMIDEAKKQAAAGSIITLCWHMLRPTEDEPGRAGESGRTSPAWSESVQGRLSDAQWLELVTSDSPLHRRWEKYVDTAAAFLKQLQDAHVPVLWRPMHENNGGFFWWGGRPGPYGTQQLYREMYNRMVNLHHLDNLIWVWNQNGPAPGGEFYSFFPGQEFVDVVSYDNYRELSDRFYHEILTIADGKPIALGELGAPPSAEVLKSQPRWVWFMTWAGGEYLQPQRIKAAYDNPYFVNRGDPVPAR